MSNMSSLDADLATLRRWYLTPEQSVALSGVEAEVARLTELHANAETYAKEGWDWLGKALEALGAKTVFDIEDRAAYVARLREGLRKIRDMKWTLGGGRGEAFTRCVDLARALLAEDTPGKDGAA